MIRPASDARGGQPRHPGPASRSSHLRRLRLADGEPIALETAVLIDALRERRDDAPTSSTARSTRPSAAAGFHLRRGTGDDRRRGGDGGGRRGCSGCATGRAAARRAAGHRRRRTAGGSRRPSRATRRPLRARRPVRRRGAGAIDGGPMTTRASSRAGWSSTTGVAPGRIDGRGRPDRGGRPRRRAPCADGPATSRPGFVDVHVHGWGGHDAMGDADALDGMARALLRRGRDVVPADRRRARRSTTSPAFAERVRAWMPDAPDDGAEPLGFNLEGPFLAPARRGAHDPAHLRAPDGAPASTLEPLRRRPPADHGRARAARRARRSSRRLHERGRRGVARPLGGDSRRGPGGLRRRRALDDPPVQRDDRRRPPLARPRGRGARSTTRPTSSSSPTASTSTRRCGR